MPSSKRIRKEDAQLELACEWGSCQESFGRMEGFCDHMDGHLKVQSMEDADSDGLGERATE